MKNKNDSVYREAIVTAFLNNDKPGVYAPQIVQTVMNANQSWRLQEMSDVRDMFDTMTMRGEILLRKDVNGYRLAKKEDEKMSRDSHTIRRHNRDIAITWTMLSNHNWAMATINSEFVSNMRVLCPREYSSLEAAAQDQAFLEEIDKTIVMSDSYQLYEVGNYQVLTGQRSIGMVAVQTWLKAGVSDPVLVSEAVYVGEDARSATADTILDLAEQLLDASRQATALYRKLKR